MIIYNTVIEQIEKEIEYLENEILHLEATISTDENALEKMINNKIEKQKLLDYTYLQYYKSQVLTMDESKIIYSDLYGSTKVILGKLFMSKNEMLVLENVFQFNQDVDVDIIITNTWGIHISNKRKITMTQLKSMQGEYNLDENDLGDGFVSQCFEVYSKEKYFESKKLILFETPILLRGQVDRPFKSENNIEGFIAVTYKYGETSEFYIPGIICEKKL